MPRPPKPVVESGERTRGGWVPTGVNASRRDRRGERSAQRGDETEQLLVRAAREVFAEHGYYDARIQDVLDVLGMSRGAFYVYFANKREVFDRVHVAVMSEIASSIAGADDDDAADHTGHDPLRDLIRSNTRFLRFYRENADILRCLEQVAAVDEHAAELSAQNRRHHLSRVRRLVEHWRDQGLVDTDVDAEAAAVSLVTMLSGTGQFLSRGELDRDEDDLGRSLSELWVRSLGFAANAAGKRSPTAPTRTARR